MICLVTAAGASRRFGGGNKLLQPIQGRPILAWTLEALSRAGCVTRVHLTAPPHDVDVYTELLHQSVGPKAGRVTTGGAERQDSIRLALQAMTAEELDDAIGVHDGARPLLRVELLEALQNAQSLHNCGAIPGYTPTDTIKQMAGDRVECTVPRAQLCAVQTPQVFPGRRLLEVHRRAAAEGFVGTDDASLFERYGYEVRVVPGDPDNIKVTTPRELAWLAWRIGNSAALNDPGAGC